MTELRSLGVEQVGFIGAGSMAEALIRGLLAAKLIRPDRIAVCNRRRPERLASLSAELGVRACADKCEVVADSDLVVLACKPRDVPEALAGCARSFRAGQVMVSVAAGVQTSFLQSLVPPNVEVVRAMPNTSCVVGESATAISLGDGAGDRARRLAVALFSCVGTVDVVAEPLLDAVTGLSGTGPAYVYRLMEAMIEAGVGEGIEPAVARALTIQTVLGAARMCAHTRAEPAELRRQVTSPNGTTMAAMQLLDAHDWAGVLTAAIRRASERSREMGRALMQEAGHRVGY